MQNKYNWPLWHWHLELSSICTLSCPRCSRTEVKEGLIQTSLTLDFIKRNFDPILEHVQRISLCGYDGDPIYCKDFLKIVEYFKTSKSTIELYIVTNGSYKTKEWWDTLNNILNEHDQIHWSLDGWDQESNEKYRVNSDWASILNGLEAFKYSRAFKTWDFIYFSYNYNHVDKVIQLANDYNFDQLRLTKSTKFGSKNINYIIDNNDSLEPPTEYISTSDRYENTILNLTDRDEPKTSYKQALDIYEQINPIGNIIPLCKIGSKGLFINSQGYLFPCCWVVHRYDVKNYLEFLTKDINIHTVGLESALNSNKWDEFISNIPNNMICNMKCKADLINKDVVGRW